MAKYAAIILILLLTAGCASTGTRFYFDEFKNNQVEYTPLQVQDTLYSFEIYDKDSNVFSREDIVNIENDIRLKQFPGDDSTRRTSVSFKGKKFMIDDIVIDSGELTDDDHLNLMVGGISAIRHKTSGERSVVLFAYNRIGHGLGNGPFRRTIIVFLLDAEGNAKKAFLYDTLDLSDPEVFPASACINDFNKDAVIDYMSWSGTYEDEGDIEFYNVTGDEIVVTQTPYKVKMKREEWGLSYWLIKTD